MIEKNICKKCVLPESKPNIWLNEQGVCNICVSYEKNLQLNKKSSNLETNFVKILNKNKGKGDFDCLVMCSGGKDSISSLYYMKERYKLNPLAFTFDHGFENEEALENIHNAVDILGVDFLFYRSTKIQDIFKKILIKDSPAVICHI